MTSNTAPKGTASSSGILSSSYDTWKALDGKNNLLTTRWISEQRTSKAGWWLAYDFGTTTNISGYFIYPETYAGRAPLSWDLQGWNGSQWINVDQRTGMTTAEWDKTNGKLFKLSNVVSYSKYRLLFNTANGSDVVSIYSFELYGNITALKNGEDNVTFGNDGIQNKEQITNISIYPNPSNGTFTVEVSGDIKQGIPVNIIDFSGKVVYTTVLYEGQTELNTILPSGVYILKTEIDGKLKCQKIIVR